MVDENPAGDPHQDEIRAFVIAVAQHDQNIVRSDYLDACKTLAVCEAAARAVLTGAAQQVSAIGTG